MPTYYSLNPNPKGAAEWRENLRVLGEFMKKGFIKERLGIGTASPSAPLHVVSLAANSAIAIFVATDGQTLARVFETTSGDVVLQLFDTSGNEDIRLSVVGNSWINSPANLGIGTAAPAASAKLEVASTTGAFLPPRMTSTQRDALTAVDGMLLYNSTTNKLQVRAAGAWVDLH